MSGEDTKILLARRLHSTLTARDWPALRGLFTDYASWTLPGDNAVSGHVEGGDAVIDRFRKIAGYGVSFTLIRILVSRENFALAIHNTARRGDVALDEHLATVCRLRGDRVAAIETYLSDVDGMNKFIVDEH